MKLLVIIPIYNEGEKVVRTVKSVLRNTKNGLILVNDGSSDNTRMLLEKNFAENKRITLVNHHLNRGKGVAMKTGAIKAWKKRAGAVIFIDADGQHDPKLLEKFEESLKSGDEVVIGVRIDKSQMSFIRKLGNWIIRIVLTMLYGQTIEDMLCGYRAIAKNAYKKILWTSRRYGVETEMMCNIWQAGIIYRKIVVETIYTEKKKQKKDCFTPKDGVKILLQIPYWWWRGRFGSKM